MPRPVSNPPNPWATNHVEWLEEPPAARLEVFEEEAKSIVSTNDSPDVPFQWSVNPYRGCQHACAYCYARPGHQHLGFGAGTDFDTKVVVKTNAAELLRQRLASRSWKREWIAFSGVTDCYQPIEASYGITRACLEVCREFRQPVGVITKSALVRRDAELLAEIGRVAPVYAHVSIPFADPEGARRIEPAASAPHARFETIRALVDAGVPTGVAIAPLIPGLNDSQIPEILERAREAGAESAFMILLRLAAEVRPVFEERLHAAFPERASKVLSALEDMRAGTQRSEFGQRMRGAGARWKTAHDMFELSCRRLGLRTTMDMELDTLGPDRAPRARQGNLFQ